MPHFFREDVRVGAGSYNLRDELGEDSGGVATLRQGLTWVDGGKKTVGFGEKHPTQENTVDGMRSQTDRRVEVMFFDGGEEPNLGATNGEDVYDGVTFERAPVEPMKSARRWTLDLRLVDANDMPIAGTAWILRHSDGEVSNITGTDGLITASVPVGASQAVMTLDGYTIDVELDALPPVEEVSGLQYRLNNLNYDCGTVNGVMTPATREAVRAFQTDHPPLAVTGDADAPTRERVRLLYGH